MNSIKIALGSTNKDKADIAKKAFADLDIKVSIKGLKVNSGITNQPLDNKTTLKGAINRAREAGKISPKADFALGLEGGLHEIEGLYRLFCFAVLIDKNNRQFVGESFPIPLPERVSNEVKNGAFFGEAIRLYAKDHEIDNNLITREKPFYEAIHNAYISNLRENGSIPYRQGVVGIIIDSENNYLVVQMLEYGDNQWRFCGGGINDEEDHESALLRELEEELGVSNFEILKESSIINRFEWPAHVTAKRYLKNNKFWRGQEQKQFLVRFTGRREDLKVDPKELKRVKWVKYEELQAHFIFENQWEQAEKTLKELLS